MQRYKKFLVFYLCCTVATFLWANPFTGTSNSPAPIRTEQPPEFLAKQQWLLHTQLGEYIYEWTQTHSVHTFWTILGIAFFYGFMHALGPGHRKTLVFSFYLSKQAPFWEPILTSVILAGLHGITSIVLLLIFRNVAGAFSVHTASATIYLEGFSYLLLLVLSVFSILHLLSHTFPHRFRHFHFGCCGCVGHEDHSCSVTKKSCHGDGCCCSSEHSACEDTDRHDTKTCACHGSRKSGVEKAQWGAFLLSGIYPCPAALLVLVLVSSLDAAGLGILAVISMSAGMTIPITVVGYLAWAGRVKLFSRMQRTQKYVKTASLVLGLIAYSSIFIFSLFAAFPFIKSLFR